jgi:hypothetical protein
MARPSSFYGVLRDRLVALTSPTADARATAVAPQASEPCAFATVGHTNAAAFEMVCRMLHERHGRKIPTTPEGTLNRLFRKHLATHHPALADDAPHLTGDNTWVTRETRPKLNFVGLSRRLETGPKISVDGGHPIVIARYRGLDLLLDGNKRCRYWYKHADRGLHDAFVLLVRDLDSR